MATATALPPTAAAANSKTLDEAMAEVKISSNGEELEDGEIREEEDDGTVKTVFDDAKRFNVKHPLYSKWTLFFDSPNSKNLPKTPASAPDSSVAHGGWMDDIRKVASLSSVEEFWGLYNNIVPPSQLPEKANYYLFKDGIMPAWEDEANKDGGKWSLQLPRDKNKAVIDRMWLYTMLAAIGETFETPLSAPGEPAKPPVQTDLVTGVICSARPRFYRLTIWTRQAADVKLDEKDALFNRISMIGKHFKTSVLGYNLDDKLSVGGASGLQSEVEFESHKASEKKGNKEKIVV